jgi:hypothetical protein
MSPAEDKARKRRNIAIALGLAAFVVRVFFVTIAQMRAGMHAGGRP